MIDDSAIYSRLKLVLWGYLVWRVKIGGSRLGSCDPNLTWHQLVGTNTRTRSWKKCFATSGIGIVKKYFWKPGNDIYVKTLIKKNDNK
jgi:hypothetical protein